MRARKRHGDRSGEQGGAAIEFALVLPLFLLLVVAMLILGQMLTVRSALAGAVYSAARTCALARDPSQACANRVVTNRMGFVANQACVRLTVATTNPAEPGYPAVNAFQVTATCTQPGGLVQVLQAQIGGQLNQVTARAVMPY